MRQKLHKIWHDQQGFSMILVLCLGALFVALAAALVYAASVLTANANRQLLEQEAYQLATSFADVLEGELDRQPVDGQRDFSTFVNYTYMMSTAYGRNIYTSEATPYTFTGTLPGGAADAGGADKITVTLQRRPGDGVDKLTQTVEGYTDVAGLRGLLDQLEGGENRVGDEIDDLQLDITVTVEKAGETFAYTRTYNRLVRYNSDGSRAQEGVLPDVCYTFNDGTIPYYRIENTTFVSPGHDPITITDTNIENYKLVFHCDTSARPAAIRYQRGVRLNTGTTGGGA